MRVSKLAILLPAWTAFALVIITTDQNKTPPSQYSVTDGECESWKWGICCTDLSGMEGENCSVNNPPSYVTPAPEPECSDRPLELCCFGYAPPFVSDSETGGTGYGCLPTGSDDLKEL